MRRRIRDLKIWFNNLPQRRKLIVIFLSFVIFLAFSIVIYTVFLLAFVGVNNLALLSGSANIYDKNGVLLRTVYAESPATYIFKTLEDIPQNCQDAVIATEDRFFYSNIGIDLNGLGRFAVGTVTRNDVGGGSTLTQQLVKLGTDRIYDRTLIDKFNEIILSIKITRQLSKQQILELYLNNAYFGNFNYGIEAASRNYFGKAARALSLAECAYLAGLPQKPSIYNPLADKVAGKKRQETVLDLMLRGGFITQAEYDDALPTELNFQVTEYEVKAPYFVEHLAHRIADYQPRQGIINWREPVDVASTYDWAWHEKLMRQLQARVSATPTYTNAAAITINKNGGVEAFIGNLFFFDKQKGKENYATKNIDPECAQINCTISLWDVASSLTLQKFQTIPYFVDTITNRNTQNTYRYNKNEVNETRLPDLMINPLRFTPESKYNLEYVEEEGRVTVILLVKAES